MARQRWVIKIGSQMLCDGGPILIRALIQQVAWLKKHKIDVIWVTSGAIATAKERVGRSDKESLAKKQALSAIGQPLIMDLYNMALHSEGLLGAQVLLTYDDFKNKTRSQNLRNTLTQLLKMGTVPILNENDAVSTEEIRFGDNDALSAKTAKLMGAKRLVILTDVDGYFESDPKKNKDARLVSHLNKITAEVLKSVKSSRTSRNGSGGMYSKLLAAKEAALAGIETWLIKGDAPRALIKTAQNEPIGTRIGK